MSLRNYEIVFLVHPGQSEQVPAMLERHQELIGKGKGKVHRLEDWGRMDLAYPIGQIKKAHYVLINIAVDQPTLQELTEAFVYNDAILRHLAVATKAAITDQSVMMKKIIADREQKAAAEKEQKAAAAEQDERNKRAERAEQNKQAEKDEQNKQAEQDEQADETLPAQQPQDDDVIEEEI